MVPSEVQLRPREERDLAFLVSLRAITMYPHILRSGRVIDETTEFERVAHRLDCAQIIMSRGLDIGLWKVVRDTNPWELCQIQILPDYQGTGIGSKLIKGLLDEAQTAHIAVTLIVLKCSPALRLYERHGFRVEAVKESVYEMIWTPVAG